MADLFDNPIGTDGFEFVEFTSPEPEKLAAYFEQIGFTAVARHRSKNVVRYKQNHINFILNMEPSGQAADFREAHGPSANAMAFRVKDAQHALREAVKRGAEPVKSTWMLRLGMFSSAIGMLNVALPSSMLKRSVERMPSRVMLSSPSAGEKGDTTRICATSAGA